jgi:fibronectin-binding autotransporter adhesin
MKKTLSANRQFGLSVCSPSVKPVSSYCLRAVCMSAVALVFAGVSVQAANITWDGGSGGVGTSWNDTVNWGGDILPGATDTVYFNSTGLPASTVISLGANQTISKIGINSYSGINSFTIGSAGDITSGYALTLTNVYRADNNGNNQTIAANVKLAADSNWNIINGYNGSMSVTGSIGSDTAVTFTKEGSNTLTVNGANTFTGNLRVIGGTLSLGGSNAYTGTTTASGGTLQLNFNTGTAPLTDIINSSSTLVLGGVRGGGAVTASGKNLANAVNSQTFSGLTINAGASTLNISNGISSGKTLVALGAITRNAGGTVNFVQPTTNTTISAQNGYTTSTSNDASGILGAYATVGGTEYAMNNGTNIVAYTGYTDQVGNVMADSATTNLRITSGTTGNITQGAGTTTVNTIRVNDAAARTITVGTGNTLRTNGILATGTNGLVIGETANAGTLTAGTADNTAAELIINNTTAVDVNSVIANNGSGSVAFTKSGAGTATLNSISTYTGGTYVNQGTLAMGASLANPTNTISTSLTKDSSTVLVASTAGLTVGQYVIGGGYNFGATITAITDATHFVVSAPASGTNANATLTYWTPSGAPLSTTGDIVVSGGTLNFGTIGNNHATSGAVVVASGTLSGGTLTKSGANYDFRNGTVSTLLAGDVGLNKTTSGTVTFSNTIANTFTGTTTISEGSVIGGSAASVTAINGDLVVGTADGSGSGASYSNSGNNVAFNANKNVTVYSNGSVNFGGGAQNLSAGVTIIGGSISGTQIYLNSTVNMTGGSYGVLGGNSTSYGNAGSFTTNASVDTAVIGAAIRSGGSTKTFAIADGAAAIDALVAGDVTSGNFSKTGAGYLSMIGGKSYSGVTSISGGTFAVDTLADGGSNSGVGKSTNVASNLMLGNGTTFEYIGSGHSTDRLFTINGGSAGDSATLNASGVGAANFTNTGSIAWGTNNQTRTLKLGGTSTADNTLAALLTNNGSGAVSITKQDAGKWILTNSNSYTGATTINGGSLIVNGSLNAGSAVSVNSGGTLGGSGTVNGAVTVNSGGFLAPGSSPGVLTVGSLNLLAGSTTSLEIAGAAVRGTDFDGITVSTASGLTYGGALNLSFSSTLTNGDSLDLFSFTGTAGGSFTSVVSTGTYDGTWSAGSGVWTFTGNSQLLTFDLSTGDLTVTASMIPEPSAYALIGGVFALVAAGWRSRRRG